jgi:hypothetical protein
MISLFVVRMVGSALRRKKNAKLAAFHLADRRAKRV